MSENEQPIDLTKFRDARRSSAVSSPAAPVKRLRPDSVFAIPDSLDLRDIGLTRGPAGEPLITMPGIDLDTEARFVPALPLPDVLRLVERLIGAGRASQCEECMRCVIAEHIVPIQLCSHGGTQ